MTIIPPHHWMWGVASLDPMLSSWPPGAQVGATGPSCRLPGNGSYEFAAKPL